MTMSFFEYDLRFVKVFAESPCEIMSMHVNVVCVHPRMYVRTYCMHSSMHVCTMLCVCRYRMNVCMYGMMDGCRYGCVYECMYVGMHICICIVMICYACMQERNHARRSSNPVIAGSTPL